MDSRNILYHEAKYFNQIGRKIGAIEAQTVVQGILKGKFLNVNGKKKIDLTRLDYLALGSSKKIKQIMIKNIKRFDLSCPASQMILKPEATEKLEKKLAKFHGMKSTVLFTSGYTANDNVIQALGLRAKTHYIQHYIHELDSDQKALKEMLSIPTVFFIDEESHYSLFHGVRVARDFSKGSCFFEKFRCMDYNELEQLLKNAEEKYGKKIVKIIASDTLSSTSGRTFDIDVLCRLAKKYRCLLYLDEAHATGAIGYQGRGVSYASKQFQKNRDRIIVMGTLTKAFSQLGGYVAVPSKQLGVYLRVCSPQYIFSAPILPWMEEVLSETIDLIKGPFGEKRRDTLKKVALYMRNALSRQGFNIFGSNTHIIPVFIGDEQKARKVHTILNNNGYVVSAFMYPSVPKKSALLRFSLCADITKEEIDEILFLLAGAGKKYRIITPRRKKIRKILTVEQAGYESS